MRVLIIGGWGYIGTHLYNELSASRGLCVRRLPSIRSLGIFSSPTTMVVESQILTKYVAETDIIFFLFGLPSVLVEKIEDLNDACDIKLAQQLISNDYYRKVKLVVYASTVWAYGSFSIEQIIDEHRSSFPVSNYGRLKYRLERLFIESSVLGPKVINLRLSNVFGASKFETDGMWQYVINDICRGGIKNGIIKLNSDGLQFRDFISINNLLRILKHIVDEHSSIRQGLYNVTSGDPRRLIDFAKEIATAISRELGRTPKIISGAAHDFSPARVFYCNQKLSDTGISIISDHAEVIRALLRCMIENRP